MFNETQANAMSKHDLINIFTWLWLIGWSAFLLRDCVRYWRSKRNEFERFKASLQEGHRIARIEAEREIHLSKADD